MDGRHPQGVELSHPREDALRRDFTINGMFYDPLADTILDYVGGQEDLKNQIIRTIGNPEERFSEDRLRMIRAVRFAARFDFAIEKQTQMAIIHNAHTLLPAVSIERIWQEFEKTPKQHRLRMALTHLYRLQLLPIIFPDLQLSQQEFEQLISPFDRFPSNCPTIVYLQELFPFYTLEQRLNLA